MPSPRTVPCLKCGYDLAGIEVGHNGVCCPECGASHFLTLSYQQPVRSIAPTRSVKCPSCSHDLSKVSAHGDITTCPECGRSYTQQQIQGTQPIPGYARSLLVMTLPLVVLVIYFFIREKTLNPNPLDAALFAAAILWGLAAPAFLSFRRARAHARVPRIAMDEAIGGYVLVILTTGCTAVISLIARS